MTIVTRGRNQWLVPSTSQVGVAYLVIRNERGELSCDCPAGFYRGGCKHALAVAAAQPRACKVDPALGLSVLLAPAK